MGRLSVGSALFVVMGVFHTQAYAMSGGEWYTACSELLVSSPEQIGSAPPEKKVKYRACVIEAHRAWCALNLEGDRNRISEAWSKDKRDQIELSYSAVCPTLWNSPIAGPFVRAVKLIERKGGPNFLERWLPANSMLKDAFLSKYPNCQAERARLGFIAEENGKCIDSYNELMNSIILR